MTRIDAEAEVFGRKPAYNLSFRPIIGATEAGLAKGEGYLGWGGIRRRQWTKPSTRSGNRAPIDEFN